MKRALLRDKAFHELCNTMEHNDVPFNVIISILSAFATSHNVKFMFDDNYFELRTRLTEKLLVQKRHWNI